MMQSRSLNTKSKAWQLMFASAIIVLVGFQLHRSFDPLGDSGRQSEREISRHAHASPELVDKVEHLKINKNKENIMNIVDDQVQDKNGAFQDSSNRGSSSSSSSSNSGKNYTEFVRYTDVVIATKIHDHGREWELLKQALCLFHHAYNHKMKYPIIIFSTIPIPLQKREELETLLSWSSSLSDDSSSHTILGIIEIQYYTDNPYDGNLQQMIHAVSPVKKQNLFQNCNVTSSDQLTWRSKCVGTNQDYPLGRGLQYNWQAEFRALHVWYHAALTKYKTMLWLDSDGFCTTPWLKDPIQFFVENNGVVMYDNMIHHPIYPKRLRTILYDIYNHTMVCNITQNQHTGSLDRDLLELDPAQEMPRFSTTTTTTFGSLCPENGRIPLVHGFFHITNLDFYRAHIQPKFSSIVEHADNTCRFLCRSPCDQLAVTLPALWEAPHRMFDMRSNEFQLHVFHNGHIDGKRQESVKKSGQGEDFPNYWNNYAQFHLPTAAHGTCPTNRYG